MQSDNISRTMGRCPVCGKEVIIRSVRDKKPQYCSRICAANARFEGRYRGTMSGPMDRPRTDKTKFEA